MRGALKRVHWVGSSLADLRAFPADVQRQLGYGLFRAQLGGRAPTAKPLKGIVKGAGVLQLTADAGRVAYRLVYSVRFADAVYVLHAFRKKAKRGTSTPRVEIELIRARLDAARAHSEGERLAP